VNHKQPIVAQPASLEDGCVADCYCKVAGFVKSLLQLSDSVCLSSRKGVCLLERVSLEQSQIIPMETPELIVHQDMEAGVAEYSIDMVFGTETVIRLCY